MTTNLLTSSSYNLALIYGQKQKFRLENIPLLEDFENFVYQLNNCKIELSCKIDKGSVYPARFNLWLNTNILSKKINFIQSVLNFFHTIEKKENISLNYGLFNQFYDHNFNLDKVQTIITGVDLRAKSCHSRLKIWFILNDYPEKLKTALLLDGREDMLRPLILHDQLLVGFDFGLNGTTKIKVYPDITCEEFKDTKLQKHLTNALSPTALNLMNFCSWVHISFTDQNEKILHYHPLEPQLFMDNFINNQYAKNINSYYKNQEKLNVVFSLKELEIETGKIENINLYYLYRN